MYIAMSEEGLRRPGITLVNTTGLNACGAEGNSTGGVPITAALWLCNLAA